MFPVRLPCPGFRVKAGCVRMLPPPFRRAAGHVGNGTAFVCLITVCLTASVHAQDSAMVDSSLFGQEMTTESTGLGLEPIGDDDAGYSGTAAEALTEESTENLKKKVLPEALLLRVALGGIYDDNLFLDETDKVEDLVMQARLGITIRQPEPGKASFSFNYEAVGFMYQEYDEFNDINHDFGLTGGLTLPKTQLGFSANYQRVSAGDQAGLRRLSSSATTLDTDSTAVDTAGTTNQQSQDADREAGSFSVRDVLAGSLTLSRSLAPKTSFTSSLNYSATLYQGEEFQDTQDYSARVGFDYNLSGKTTIGFAATYGQLDNGANSTQTYQNLLLTASYNASGKLVFRGEAGVEMRQYGRRQPIEVATVTPPVTVPVVPVVEPVPEVVTPAPAPVVTPPVVVTPPPVTPMAAAAADPGPITTDPTVTPPVVVSPAATPAPAQTTTATVPVEPVAVVPVVTDPNPVVDYTTTELPQEEDSTRFVFNLQAAYQMRVRTTLRLSASRGTGGSATLGSPSVERTTLSMGLDQGVGQRFAIGLEAGYQLEDYASTTTNPNASTAVIPATETEDISPLDPNQIYWFGRATLNYMPRPNTSIGVFYEFRNNDGGGTGRSYEANRFGVQAAISF